MSGYSLGLYEKSMPHSLTLPEKLEKVKDFGFDFLEVSVDETDEKLARLNWEKAKRREVMDMASHTGISLGSMCLSGHRKYPLGSLSEATRRKSIDIMERAIDLASDWGIRIIQLAGYDVYYEQGDEQTKAYFKENLFKSVEMASKSGIILAFETMETPFMDTVEKAMYYVSEINSPYLQIYPDLGNLANAAKLYGHSVCEDMQMGHGHIVALHLKETLPDKYRDIPYGTGHTNFAEGIKTARQLGVNRFVGEFWDNGEFEAQIDFAHTFLRGFLDDSE
jgi:predicted hexulose-6-phosphate isomerase